MIQLRRHSDAPAYTIAMRERAKPGPLSYVGDDLKLHTTTLRCKRLTREEAALAKHLLMDSAKRDGLFIEVRIVRMEVQ